MLESHFIMSAAKPVASGRACEQAAYHGTIIVHRAVPAQILVFSFANNMRMQVGEIILLMRSVEYEAALELARSFNSQSIQKNYTGREKFVIFHVK